MKSLKKIAIISLLMQRGEVAGTAPLPSTIKPLDMNAPSVRLWEAIDAADKRIAAQTGTPLLPPTPRTVLHLYLTTEATTKLLKPVAGVGSDDGVRYQVVSSLEKVFPYLPDDLRQQYGTPKQALRSRSGKGHQVQHFERTPDGKAIALSQGQSRRWQRYRDIEKPQGKPAFSEQGLANIRAHAGRRKKQPEKQ